MRILNYFILLLLLPVSHMLAGQSDTLFSPSLRLGADVSGLVRYYFEPETMSLELSADYEWRKDWFVTAEAGMLDIDIRRETHNYLANGYFLRAGADYNILNKHTLSRTGIVYASLRYGYGLLNHEAPGITISMPYWDDFNTGISNETIHAHWLETGGGIKTRLAGNIYLGWTLRARFMLYRSPSPGIDPYYISGFGKIKNNPAVMVHYYIYYQFR